MTPRSMQQGVYTLEQPAPIPEWQTPGDPRAKIRIMDILRSDEVATACDFEGYPDWFMFSLTIGDAECRLGA